MLSDTHYKIKYHPELGKVIHNNILKKFGTIRSACTTIGVSRPTIYGWIKTAKFSDYSENKLRKCGVDPQELIQAKESV
jgi:hypothetical protein